MEKKAAKSRSCLQPVPKVLVSCRGKNGEQNALAVAYCCNCSFDPPMVMVGIVPTRYSHKLIKESGCFVVNLTGKRNKELFDYLGTHSGRDGDKLKASGARLTQGAKVDAPLLADCPVNIECTIVDSVITGSHEMFIGKVEAVHADGNLVDENGAVDHKAADYL